jgi:hypothetical protein
MKPRPICNGAATVEYSGISEKDGKIAADYTVKFTRHTIRLLKLMKKGSARVRIKNMKRVCEIFDMDWEEVKTEVEGRLRNE